MIAYINPKYGNDATARFAETEDEAKRFAYKTREAGLAAYNGLRKALPQIPHTLRESYKPPPQIVAEEDPQMPPIDADLDSEPVTEVIALPHVNPET